MAKKERILIVDDEADLRNGLARTLQRDFAELDVVTAGSGLEALDVFAQESLDVALVDIRMPEMDGLTLLEKFQQEDPQLTVIIMTAFATIETAVAAIRKGAYDFITKPFDKDILLRVVRKALERNRLIRENMDLKERVCEKEALGTFVGTSKPMQQFYQVLQTVARTDYTVLVRGESGTGKELAARSIHQLSKRRYKPYIVVNCPAIPEHLLESELFGHKRGAFTGADKHKKGLFAVADGGTICLDEIADIPVTIQTKLLRVLQEQEIKPLGANTTQKIDVRIIASTNQNLEKKISARTFREDLFYRLNTVTLKTVPLKKMQEDIPLLVTHFSKKVCCELELDAKQFSQAALDELARRSWPGNVRELQNVVRQAIMFCPERIIDLGDLPSTEGDLAVSATSATPAAGGRFSATIEPYKEAKEKVINDFTADYISHLLRETGGNVTRAAQLSGLTRAALQKIMKRLSIEADRFREEKDTLGE